MAYEKAGKVLEWKGGATSGADLDALANCSALWLKAAPYRAAARAPPRAEPAGFAHEKWQAAIERLDTRCA